MNDLRRVFRLLGILVLVYPTFSAAHDPFQFERSYVDTNYGGNGKPGWVRAADMDNDGDIDLMAGGGGGLFFYENNGNADPSQWPRRGSGSAGLDSTGSMGANGAVLYDVDGDGFKDVVCAKYNSDLGWWENPGAPIGNSAWTFHRLAAANRYMHDLFLGDLDGDGQKKEFIANLNQGYWNARITINWYTPGSNPFADWESHVVESDRAEGAPHGHAGFDVADINGDGNRDIVYSNGWYKASSSPQGAWTWYEITTIYGISNALASDMDKDGDMDIIVGGGHHGQGVVWLENTGSPENSNWPQHPVSAISGNINQRWSYNAGADVLHHPECLQLYDFDFDGNTDVVTCDLFFGEDSGEPGWSSQSHNIYIYTNSGDPDSWHKHNIAPNSYPSHLLQLADIDLDSRKDIISESAGYSVISFYRNTGALTQFSYSLEVVDGSYAGNGRPGWSASGDIDKDGDIDVVSGGGSALQWYEAPSWVRHPIENPTNAGGNGGLVFDVDGDGDLDVVAALYRDDLVWWENPYPTNVTGTWTRHSIDNANLGYNHDLVRSDINGDGKRDVVGLYVSGGGGVSGVYWYSIPANPEAQWPKVRILNSVSDPYVGLAVGDLDRDGDNDVMVSNKWFENVSPAAADWTPRNLFSEAVQNCFIRDVNHDGINDVLGSQGFSTPGKVFWAKAPESPRTSPWAEFTIASGLTGPENLYAGDLNADGKTEVVTGEMRSGSQSTFLIFEADDAAASGWQRHTMSSSAGIFARINPVDIDNDGDIDFTADGNAEDHIYLWRNTGSPVGRLAPRAPGNLRIQQ